MKTRLAAVVQGRVYLGDAGLPESLGANLNPLILEFRLE